MKRGNGQGSVFKLPNGKYKAVKTLGYWMDEQGKRHRSTRSVVCDKKKDAVAALATLEAKKRDAKVTLGELFNMWLPTHKAGKSTLDCYKAAVRHFKALYCVPAAELDVDDLQDCIDSCGHGKRTQENMRAALGLAMKYGIPRDLVRMNLAPYLRVGGEAPAERDPINDVEIKKIASACGIVPYAEDVMFLIYTGFRPSEALELRAENYIKKDNVLVGGAKTAAGKGRRVTISPKIQAIVDEKVRRGGYLLQNQDGDKWELRAFTEEAFYPCLEQIGISNPIVDVAGGVKRHRLTPHSCRHTFATLLKSVTAADADKLKLIGHASAEMLRYYQSTNDDDLRRITDAI